MSTPATKTAYALAMQHALIYWPYACPVCGDTRPECRLLLPEPGPGASARYRCASCYTTFARGWHLVTHAIARVSR